MKPLVKPLDAIESTDIETHGGKATNLARLIRAGFFTPKGFSIPSHYFYQIRNEIPEILEILQELEQIDDFEEIISKAEQLQELMSSYHLSEDLKQDVLSAFNLLQKSCSSSEFGFAVRSSASIEDRGDISFAGQAESYLCVNEIRGIYDAIKHVWRSAYSPSALVYLKAKGIPIQQVKMAVVVQEMIKADISGVMFTANVVSNNNDEVLINSTWGLGESLVSGKVIPDMYIVHKTKIGHVQRELGTKQIMSLIQTMDDTVMTRVYETPAEKRDSFTLDDSSIMRLVRLGLQIEREMGFPQDIEWSMKDDGEIVILQTRPITTLRNLEWC